MSDFLYSPDEDPIGPGPSIDDDFDSSQDPPIKDVSGLFNERGFYKANGLSFNEEEIINDFSGNLVYNIPLYNYKLHGELPFDLKLVYNGSVSHSIKIGDPISINTGLKNTYNMNMPEWLLSINGICVQAFNFISKCFSKPATNSSTLQDYYINMQIPGYHYTNDLRVITTGKDTILLLMGDGSTITLENELDGPEETHYTGNYKGKGKENYVKAKVDYIESQSVAPYPYYRRRKIILMRGDGLEYVFEEVKNQFTDFTANQSLRQKPMMPLLREINDRFGFSIKLNYTGEYSSNYGRPFLNNISVVGLNSKQTLNFNIEYYNRTINIYHESDLNSDYYIRLEDEGTYYIADDSNNKNRIGRVKQITNSLNQTFDIEYKTNASDEYYSRKYTGVYNPFGPTLSVDFNKLKRIRKIKTFLDLRRSYNYKDELAMQLHVSSLYSEDPPHLLSSRFKGYGRDTFFSNMLSDRTEFYIENGNVINKNKIIYTYSYAPVPSNRDLSRKPICRDDLVGTDKTLLSLDNSTINNSESGLIKNLSYCIFPLYDPNNHFAYTPDVDASTKLIEDKSRNNSDGSTINVKSFEYDSGTGDPLTGGYNGSFLMKKKIDSYNNISRIWEWEYMFKDSNPDNFIIESHEKDPFQSKLVKKFKDFFTTFDHKLFSNDFNFSSIPQASFNFFMFNLIEEEYIELSSAPGVKNNRKKYYYIDTTNDNKGYIGQKTKEQTYENNTSNTIETNYLYCKNDRTGETIFQDSGSFPFKEGNIREVIKPNGQVTKFYYHPIAPDEVIIGGTTDEESDIPYLKYFIKYNNNSIVEDCDKIWDHRFPIRTDNVKRVGNNDTILLTTYKSYTLGGSPDKSIEQYKFLTEFKYQKIHRISKITLPGDFSTDLDGEEVIIIDNIYEVDTTLKSNRWGKINVINEGYYTDTFNQISNHCADFYSVYRYDPSAPEWNIKMCAFIGFGIEEIGIPITVEICTLRVFFRNFPQTLNNVPYLPKQAFIKGITGFEDIHGGDCPGYGKRFSLHQNQSVYNVTINIPNAYNENLIDLRNIIADGLKGFLMVPFFNFEENGYIFYSDISFLISAPPDQNWYDNYSPSLILKGTFNKQIIIRKPLFRGGTLTYLYDDVNNKIDTYAIRNTITNEKSQTTCYIDHSGNIKRSDIFTGGTPQTPTYDTFLNTFNYLNNPSTKIDGVGNVTKFSYDGLQRLVETENADVSITQTIFSYQDSIQDYYFNGPFTGFIEKQTFIDENENKFEKYFDALGKLRREVKFLSAEIPAEGDMPPSIKLITDYLYDSFYRLIKVKTPEGKVIEYQYDGYGRQNKRITVDSGIVKFQYDSNNNLVTSQDANQSSIANYIFTFRKYDALSRITVIGENSLDRGDFSQIDPDVDIDYTIGDNPDPYFDYLIVNVYDDLSTASASIFSPPPDYLPTSQNYYYFTKGRLVATAYRTRKTDLWNFKYYKYDERGRVGTMWHVMDGLETKKIEYNYNSQDQLTNYTIVVNPQESKRFKYDYDKPGRMKNLLLYTGAEELDNPLYYTNLAQYTYNSNSLISRLGLNDNKLKNDYTYNDRNWIQNCISQEGILAYNMFYYPNGNVQSLDYNGNYNNNFFPYNDLEFLFSYDKSNRLLSANCSNFSNKAFDLDNTYDKDGNILTLKRFRGDGFLTDDFAYTYYAGTNKLKKVSDIYEDFLYDNNGNLKSDDMNKNIEIKYDHRNLITLIKHLIYGIEGEFYTTAIYYYYDEAGNRIRKVILQSYINKIEVADSPEDLKNYPEYDEKTFEKEAKEYSNGDLDSPTTWFLVSNEYYLRGVDGKEIALFKGMNIERFNIWGRDNEGYIDLQNHKYYYIKDHLGSVRVVVNESNNIVSAQDYDMWGSTMEGRSFDSYKGKYKFTGKERDKESNYDYFGARYYDSRIGRWGSVEPLIDKYPNISPYNYSINNPLIISDPNGKDPRREQLGSLQDVVNLLQNNLGKSYDELKDVFGSNVGRYIYTEVGGFIDMQHFFAAAHESSIWGVDVALGLGELKEMEQEIVGSSSAWNPEDLPSNKLGAIFGSSIAGNRHNLDINSFIKYINSLKPVDPSDPKIAKDKIYIPEKDSDPSLPKRKSYEAYHGEKSDYRDENRK